MNVNIKNQYMSIKKCQRCQCEFNSDFNKKFSSELNYFLSKTKYNCLCIDCLSSLEKLSQEAKKETFPIPRESYMEGKHFYIENGLFVFTEYFHMLKGECCRNNCKHCAYGYRI